MCLSKSERQLQDGLHKTTKQFVDWCVENEVKEVAFGDVDGCNAIPLAVKRKRFGVERRTKNYRIGLLEKYMPI